MLLPMPRKAAEDMSLVYHLALAVCRKDQGNAHLLNELVKALYLTYYLQVSGFSDAPLDLYRHGEAALEQAGRRAIRDGVWGIGAEMAPILEEILSIHDQQLASAAMWNIIDAQDRLSRFIQSDQQSPLPAGTALGIQGDDAGFDESATSRNLQ
ncbi:hypothetical protein DID96_37020 [Burkholderia sp. Bp8963]|uniref:hypothetical protein n=1 Tax=Burkholderia sp. Bp8963 TaxID=2184547 RepID=UPI000F597E95|nr:hypothetical protein [Burkholderia sp. Bp8963]RQS56873.1 hypothetical protein DID96_37020 [Burkholderia sp. Bp8963]